jgi:transcriptional regulator with XRE-family HTH domain
MKRLGKLISNWRWAEKLTAREAAAMIGLSPSTYSRLERGYSVDGGTLAIVLTWLLQPGAEAPAAPAESLDADVEETPAEVHAG